MPQTLSGSKKPPITSGVSALWWRWGESASPGLPRWFPRAFGGFRRGFPASGSRFADSRWLPLETTDAGKMPETLNAGRCPNPALAPGRQATGEDDPCLMLT